MRIVVSANAAEAASERATAEPASTFVVLDRIDMVFLPFVFLSSEPFVVPLQFPAEGARWMVLHYNLYWQN